MAVKYGKHGYVYKKMMRRYWELLDGGKSPRAAMRQANREFGLDMSYIAKRAMYLHHKGEKKKGSRARKKYSLKKAHHIATMESLEGGYGPTY